MSHPPYQQSDRDAVYRVIQERRDVRRGFLPDEVTDVVLERVLAAAHRAPSVGLSQPWDFLVLRDRGTRERVAALVQAQRQAFARTLPPARARAFAGLKVDAVLDTPVNLVVTCDPTRGGRHVLGRHADPRTAEFSVALAVQNLWLAARAEGLGVGWVSFAEPAELSRELGLPDHVDVVAYLCLGHVEAFGPAPELALEGWARQRPLGWAVHHEAWGRRQQRGESVSVIQQTVQAVRPADQQAVAAGWARQHALTKPRGALGVLEEVGAQLCGIAGQCPPPLPEPVAVAVFAADHGVHAQGVTPWPQEVTAQMVANILAGGAVVNAFARQAGADVCVVDVGVAGPPLDPAPGLLRRRVRAGTADLSQGPALTRDEVVAALEVGIEVGRDLVTAGNRLLVAGDMGIANTTASAALIATFCRLDPAAVTGRGTGVDDEVLAHKVAVVRAAMERHAPDPGDPIGVLAAFGGLEHAAIAGFLLAGAAARVPVVLDGVIAGAAALAARSLAPDAVDHWVAGHRSTEPGAAAALRELGLRPLVDLDLRLGEGSGAVLAVPLVQAAARTLAEVATFDSAGVTDKAEAGP
ncbi:nicotinate-nucleotide--dimethylbenzimidazole phosphoribosyltransferase [Angustibacter sp. McL0619]|uniref:nicotinate-nucleotide--dimethylbenzimidazole phosphoribosyltransferase n=1 Tax=Angustibacter sp. McL0619 TaxID=3415676 RepID=UPI003CEF56CF